MTSPQVIYNPFTNNLDYANTGGASGFIVGPASSINNNIVIFDGITGKLVKDSNFNTSSFLKVANNLSDVANDITSFDNISPTTSKGDLITNDGTNNIRIPVGTDTYVLSANSATPSGLQWVLGMASVNSVSGTANRITSTGGATPVIDIAPTYVGQTSITTLGTVATGVWNATTIAVNKGGTGLTAISQGDLLFGSGANTYSALAKSALSSRYLSNTGASNNPSWAQIALTTGVTGILPISNGGTNASSMATNTGIVKYDGTRLVTSSTARIDASNRQTNTSQPCVSAYKNAADVNATGDGSNAFVIFDTEFVDQGGNYDTATGLFTAPVTGNYQYNVIVALTDITAVNTSGWLVCQLAAGNRQTNFFNPYAVLSSNYAIIVQSNIIAMTAGQTLGFLMVVNGGAKTVGIGGLSAIGVVTSLSVSLLN